MYCAAVDLGATSGRVIVGAWQRERLTLTEVHRFPNLFRSLAGHEYWDLPYLWAEVRCGLARAREQFPALASVGVDSWGVDHVLVGDDGRPVHPVYAYRDTRTARFAAAVERSGAATVYGLTGVPNLPFNTAFQLQETLAACPAMADAATRCLFISDYFNFLLSGRMENEISIASHSELLDVHSRDWSPGAFAFFGLPRHWFTSPMRSPRRLGAVKGFAELKGVQAVLVPGHDTACAFAAMPAAADGSDLYLSSGTWSLLGFESTAPLLGEPAREARISNERMGDGSYRPLRNSLGLWLLERLLPQFASRPRTAADWRKLIAAARQAPAPARLLDLSDASLFNPPQMRAAIDAQLRKARVAAPRDLSGYVRLVCESLGRGHAGAVQTFQKLSGRTFRRLLVVGGGSRNPLLCQSTADATGLPVVSFSLEGSAVGNLASQLIALGAVGGLAAFRDALARQLPSTSYQPRSAS